VDFVDEHDGSPAVRPEAFVGGIDGTAQVEIVYKEDDPPPKASKPLEEADFEPEELLPELPPIRKDADV
jgi:hypothetical protein